MKKISPKDIITIGFALFAMFFGAGNLIFPPQLGILCGPSWWVGFLFYFFADLGLAVAAVNAMVRLDGDVEKVADPLGRIPSLVICTAIIVCIGPGLAIPRTAATTYEMGILPLLGAEGSRATLAIMSVMFFAVVLVMTIKPGKVLDIIGKFLTPILVLALALLIVMGIVAGGDIPARVTDSVAREGISNGYQTMDLLAATFFAVLVLNTAKAKGYTEQKSLARISLLAASLAAGLLFFVYGGLSYLGATTGNIWREEVLDGSMSAGALVSAITDELLGSAGTMVLALVVTAACLTTAIGLVSASAEYFVELLGGKLSYKKLVIIMCVVSAAICNLGLSQIISISAPILTLLYPVTILMIITVFARNKVTSTVPYKLAAVVTMLYSIVDVLGSNFGIQVCEAFSDKFPLSSYGFGWLVPALVVFVIAGVATKRK